MPGIDANTVLLLKSDGDLGPNTYLYDPGFEDLSGGTPGWGASYSGETVSNTSAENHSGGHSAQIVVDALVDNPSKGIYAGPISMPAGTLRASAWVKAPAGAVMLIAIAKGDWSAVEGQTGFTGTGAWQQVTVDFVTWAAATHIFWIATQTPSITFYVDDCEFVVLNSGIAKSSTALNGAAIDVGQSKFGGASAQFIAGDLIECDNHPDYDFGAGDFTIDFWIRISALPGGQQCVVSKRSGGTGFGPFHILVNTSGLLQMLCSTDGSTWNVNKGAGTIGINQWYHVAMVRNGANFYGFLDGTLVTTASTTLGSSALVANAIPPRIGADAAGANAFVGWIDEFRISKGIARWTSNFTPPAAAYTDDVSTILLLHCDGVDGSLEILDSSMPMVESSQYAHSLDPIGFVGLDGSQKKFGSSSLSLYGSSLNSGPNYIRSADSADWNFGAGDFTIDLWVRFQSLPTGAHTLLRQTSPTDSDRGWAVWWQGGGSPNLNIGLSTTGGGASWTFTYGPAWTPTINTWYHLAFVRTGNVIKLFVNGTQLGTDQAFSGTCWDSAQNLTVGGSQRSGSTPAYEPFYGWLDEIRISKGIARWTTTFTPPTAPYVGPYLETGSAISGTLTSGLHSKTFAKQNLAISDKILSGPRQRDRTRTGLVIGQRVASGPRGGSVSRKNIVIANNSLLSGPKQLTRQRTGLVISPSVASGVDALTLVRKNIAIVNQAIASGVDAITLVRKNIAIVGNSILSGADASTFSRRGLGISGVISRLQGVDQAIHARQNIVVSPAILSGLRNSTVLRTGIVISSNVIASGADSITRPRKNIIVSDFTLSGPDAEIRPRSGIVIAGSFISGPELRAYARQNFVILNTLASGVNQYIAAKSGIVVVTNSIVSAADFPTFVRTNIALIGNSILSGFKLRQYGEQNIVVSNFVASAIDQYTATETGLVISTRILGGSGYKQGQITKTGIIVVSASILSGGENKTLGRKNIVIAPGVLSGVDASLFNRKNTVISDRFQQLVITATGNEITDALRALNAQGDGRYNVSVTNLVRNGGFESNNTDWGFSYSAGSVGSISRITNDGKFGSSCAQFDVVSVASWHYFYNSYIAGKTPPYFDTAQKYTISFWAKLTAGSNNWRIAIQDGASTNIVLGAQVFTPTASWQQFSFTFTPAVAGNTPVLFFYAATVPSTLRVDGVQVEMSAELHDYVETNGAIATAIQYPSVTNLIPNGGFEANLTGWAQYVAANTLSRVVGDAKFGIAYLRVVQTIAGNFGAKFPTFLTGAPIGRVPYTWSAWVRAGNAQSVGKTIVFQVNEEGGAQAVGGIPGTYSGLLTGDWQKISGTGTPAQADRTALSLYFYTSGTAGQVGNAIGDEIHIDGVQFETGSVAHNYIETNGAIATSFQGDSSYGVWAGSTNLIRNGSFETNLTNWQNYGGGVATRITSDSKFGGACAQVVTPGLVGQEGIRWFEPTTGWVPVTGGQTYTFSMWVKAPVGARMRMYFDTYDSANVIVGSVANDFVGTGTWQWISRTYVLQANSAHANLFIFTSNVLPAQAVTFYVDGVQFEQYKIPTPYIHTDGATVTRNAGRVSLPSTNILSAEQGWVAARINIPVKKTGYAIVAEWCDNPQVNQQLTFMADGGGGAWRCTSVWDGVSSDLTSTPSLTAGDHTAIMAWTPTQLSLSVDGAAFITIARGRGNIRTPFQTTFQLGARFYSGLELDGNIRWFAAGGGVISQTDVATLVALGNADPVITTLPESAWTTAVWTADTTAYRGSVPGLTGVDVAEHTRKNIVITPSVLSGVDVAEHTRKNIVISPFVVSGADASTFNRQNIAISMFVSSGARSSEEAKDGTVISDRVISGTRQRLRTRTGIVISERTWNALVNRGYQKKGNAILPGLLFGVQLFITKSRPGHVRSTRRAFGVEVGVFTESGKVISDRFARGDSVAVFTESGKLVSAFSAKGVKQRFITKTGRADWRVNLTGFKRSTFSEKGLVVGSWLARGQRARQRLRAGLVLSTRQAMGKHQAVHPKTGQVVIQNSKVSGVKLRIVPRAGKAIVTVTYSGTRHHTAARAGTVKIEALANGNFAIVFSDNPDYFERTLLEVVLEAPELISAGDIPEPTLTAAMDAPRLTGAQRGNGNGVTIQSSGLPKPKIRKGLERV